MELGVFVQRLNDARCPTRRAAAVGHEKQHEADNSPADHEESDQVRLDLFAADIMAGVVRQHPERDQHRAEHQAEHTEGLLTHRVRAYDEQRTDALQAVYLMGGCCGEAVRRPGAAS